MHTLSVEGLDPAPSYPERTLLRRLQAAASLAAAPRLVFDASKYARARYHTRSCDAHICRTAPVTSRQAMSKNVTRARVIVVNSTMPDVTIDIIIADPPLSSSWPRNGSA